MTKELLIFGAYGALGKGITVSMLNRDYSRIYLFDRRIETPVENDNVVNITVGDLSKEEEVKKVFDKIKPAKDKFFFLFSSLGGFFGGKSLADTEVKDWDNMFDMNLKTNFIIAKYFTGLVKRSAGGSICFTSAITAINQAPDRGAYDASKSALISLVKTLALEGKSFNLSANAVAPYIIDTPANRKWMSDSDFGKWVKPKEIGNLVESVFASFHIMTGNLLKLTERLEIE